jgi:hypothetical protein
MMSTKKDSILLGASIVYCIVCIIWLIVNLSQIDPNSNLLEELLSPIIHLILSILLVLLFVKRINHENNLER